MPTYSPTGRIRVFRGPSKEVEAATLIGHIVWLANSSFKDEEFYFTAAHAICGVWGADVPWIWHLKKCMATQRRDFFKDGEWTRLFIDGYFITVNQVQKLLVDEVGADLTL